MLLLAEVSIKGLKVHIDDTPTYLLIGEIGNVFIHRDKCFYPQYRESCCSDTQSPNEGEMD